MIKEQLNNWEELRCGSRVCKRRWRKHVKIGAVNDAESYWQLWRYNGRGTSQTITKEMTLVAFIGGDSRRAGADSVSGLGA